MSIFAPLQKLLKEGAPSADRLAESLASARKIETSTQAEVDRLGALKTSLLDSDEATIARNRTNLAEARDKLELASAYVEELTKRHQAQVDAVAEQSRLDRYNAARVKADAAETMLAKAYPKLCRDALALLKSLAEAQVAADAVNEDLPASALPILDPEIAVRGIPGTAREVVSDTEVERWVRLDLQTPVDDAFESQIYPAGKPGWGKRVDDLEAGYLKARFRRVEYKAALTGVHPMPLASFLRLPALKGDGMAWGIYNQYGFEPALHAAAFGADAPHQIVARVAEIEATATSKPVPVERPIRIEWTMLGYVGETGHGEPQSYHTRSAQPQPSSRPKFGSSPFSTSARKR